MVASYVSDDLLAVNLHLVSCVKANEIFGVDVAIDQGADINFANLQEPINLQTPLRAACALANVKMTRLLLSHDADVFAHFALDGWTALHSACYIGHDHVARLLLEEAASLHEGTWQEGWSLMHLVALCITDRLSNRGASLICWLLKQMPGVELNAVSKHAGFYDWTPLHVAAARGMTQACSALIKAKADVLAASGDFHVSSPHLNKFALAGSIASIGAGFDKVEGHHLDKGLLPLHLAAFGGHERTCQLLLRQATQSIHIMTHRHCWTALLHAVWSNNVELVRELCRQGARKIINEADRRGDGTSWSPISLAVIRGGPDMVQVLVEYGADPLMRMASSDFPGSAFVKYCSLALPDAAENSWSGPDSRISLLHLAICRGCSTMVKALMPLLRTAHQQPVRLSSSRPPLTGRGASPWQDLAPKARARGQSGALTQRSSTPRSSTPRSMPPPSGERSAAIQDQARERLISGPCSEAQGNDPVTFRTSEGWSPVILAVLLQTVDPDRRVCPFPITRGFPDRSAGSRANVLQDLLAGESSPLADLEEDKPLLIPQRFPDVAATLVNMAINEFIRLCRSSAEQAVDRILHSTLCAACHLNRMQIVQHLLEAGRCDPRCTLLKPIEQRPLHIATSHGYGRLAQLLLDYKANPLEADENHQRPVLKLTEFFERQLESLQARVAELEAQLCEGRADTDILSAKSSPKTRGLSRAGRKTGGGPIDVASYEALLHDSRI
ncbi:Ank3 [Symbiodinium natans]|uniref:Ank3 protein n=1 Tax=Symbiodinium natans TaxID=878477 RepID=A0A812V0K3_9DINO|nr:Ank3 [Symbiodinium natans]